MIHAAIYKFFGLTGFILLITCQLSAQIFLTPQVDSIPMRDGKRLAADIYIPAHCTQCPTILIQTPYNRKLFRLGLPLGIRRAVDSMAYNFVITDWRGFYGSLAAITLNPKRGEDGYDVVEWIASQSWSDGKIATWGPSALGNVQYQTAREHPPHLVCAVPVVSEPQFAYEEYYPGGVLRKEYVDQLDGLGFGVSSLLLANPVYNLLWSVTENSTFYPDEIEVPMFLIGGWYDHNIEHTMTFFNALQQQAPVSVRDRHKILIGPWTHGGSGVSRPGSATQGELSYPNAVGWNDSLTRRFLAYYLLDSLNGWDTEPVMHYYQMGENQWQDAGTWPPAGKPTFMFLGNNGYLNPLSPETIDTTFTYDPRDPSPTHGGATLRIDQVQGPYDQRDTVENRNDVLTFTSHVLFEEAIVRGQPEVKLYISSDRKDTDIAIRLTDVYPDGKSMLLTDDIARLRFRNGFTAADTALMIPGQVYEVNLMLPDLAHTFLPGHQIRLHITGSNYPKYDLNLNNGGAMYVAGDTLVATNSIYSSPSQMSYVKLPTLTTVGIDKVRPEVYIQVYPSPAQDVLHVTWNEELGKELEISIFSLNGKKVLRHSSRQNSLNINIRSLPPGYYLLEAKSGSHIAVKKFLKE